MIESLDIVKRLDEDPKFGPPALAPAADRKDIDGWMSSAAMLMRRLVRPRHAVTPLPEFQVIDLMSWTYYHTQDDALGHFFLFLLFAVLYLAKQTWFALVGEKNF